MKDRIQKIISAENLTASKFADIIAVQRSSISHLVAGRNQPSLDIVKKILKSFPKINSDWLIFGEGNMYKDNNNPAAVNPVVEQKPVQEAEPVAKMPEKAAAPIQKPVENNIQPAAEAPKAQQVSDPDPQREVAKVNQPSPTMEYRQPNTNSYNPGFGFNQIIVFNNANNTYSVFSPAN